LVPVLDIIA